MGLVWVDASRCVGCWLCVLACPFGMIHWDATRGQARKCDLCFGRLWKGEPPTCVAGCPTRSLSLAATGDLLPKRRLLALQTALAASGPAEE